MTNDLLFVYGTLLLADNEFANYLTAQSTYCCKGKIQAKLYDVGHYPALIIDTKGNYDVWGYVYRLHDADKVLKNLDRYEGYGEGEEEPYLYIRKALSVKTDEGMLTCWVYLYNWPINGLREIPSGDYLAYLKKSI